MEGFRIHPMSPQDIPSAHALAIAGGLVRSRGPDQPSRMVLMKMQDYDHNLALVAVPNGDPGRVVATAMISSEATWYRQDIARLNGVVTHPNFRRQNLATAIICRLLWHAQHIWECSSMQWTCEDVPERQASRAWYRKTFGAVNIPGSPGEFIIRFPWMPAEAIAPFYANHFDNE